MYYRSTYCSKESRAQKLQHNANSKTTNFKATNSETTNSEHTNYIIEMKIELIWFDFQSCAVTHQDF